MINEINQASQDIGNIKNIGNLLVVGDWFIDEYWFIVRHHSDVSSHTGPVHYRVVSEPKDRVKDLCGGGLITRVLYELRNYQFDGLENKIKEINNALSLVAESITDDTKKWQINEANGFLNKIEKEESSKRICSLQTIRILNKIIEFLNNENTLSKMGGQPIQSIKPIETIESVDENKRTKYKNKQYNIYGLGRWNPLDDDLIKHFVHAHCQIDGTAVYAPFSLMPQKCQNWIDADIQNLEEPKDSKCATTRCIRAYRFVSSEFKQLHRIDWELAPNESVKTTSLPQKCIKLLDNSFSAVIVEDHKKGVIDLELINKIKEKIKTQTHTKWYVRTKNNSVQHTDKNTWPDWLQDFIKKEKNIELLAIGPEIACRSYPINGLLTKNDYLAEHAYALINNLIDGKTKDEINKRKVKNVALTSDKLEVVVLLGDFCFIAKPPAEIKNIDLEKINWTTAFFAALIYEMLTETDWKNDQKICREMVEDAIKNAYDHSGVRLPQVLRQPNDKKVLLYDDAAGYNMTELKAIVYEWPKIQEEWTMAKEKKGIINPGKQSQRLELWRASTDLPGYIACIQEKRTAIQRIWKVINSFINLQEDVKNSLSILLEADPAVGKTYLARKLADRMKCDFVQHDITQMIEREDLIDFFDMVANAQAKKSSKPVFVFVDEINATLGGSPVYGAFLSPLEAGNYMRNGKRIQLNPCIWMFAGTPRRSGTDEKRVDFESRMTLIERIDYSSIKDHGVHVAEKASLELVYLGAQFINNAFNDVIRIDDDILEIFFTLSLEEEPARLIRRLASSLENVQYGRIHKGNCTSVEWRKIIESRIAPEDHWKWTKEFQPSDNDVNYVILDLN